LCWVGSSLLGEKKTGEGGGEQRARTFFRGTGPVLSLEAKKKHVVIAAFTGGKNGRTQKGGGWWGEG